MDNSIANVVIERIPESKLVRLIISSQDNVFNTDLLLTVDEADKLSFALCQAIGNPDYKPLSIDIEP